MKCPFALQTSVRKVVEGQKQEDVAATQTKVVLGPAGSSLSRSGANFLSTMPKSLGFAAAKCFG